MEWAQYFRLLNGGLATTAVSEHIVERTERFLFPRATVPGVCRADAICSILEDPGVVVADSGRMEAVLCCFPVLFVPPQLSSSTSI